MSYLTVKNLSHQFENGKLGLANINLTVEKGEFIVIAGKNGSGKTTFCRHLNGLLKPTHGSIEVDGIIVEKHPSKIRQKVGLVFQNADAQIIGETVYNDIAFGPENLGLPLADIQKRVQHALKTTGLEGFEDQPPHILSGGEKRKLAIAGILAMQPDMIVFDEPFSNLDYPGSIQILEQILELHRTRHTIVIVTHELEKVIAHADRLVIFDQGSIASEGDPETIIPAVEDYGIRQPCSTKLGHGIVSWLN